MERCQQFLRVYNNGEICGLRAGCLFVTRIEGVNFIRNSTIWDTVRYRGDGQSEHNTNIPSNGAAMSYRMAG